MWIPTILNNVSMFARVHGWAHNMGISPIVVMGLLVAGVAAGVSAWLKQPLVGGFLTIITGVVTAVVQKRTSDAAKADELEKRWAAAVDAVSRPADVPEYSVAALLRPEVECVPYNHLHAKQLNDLNRWALYGRQSLHLLTGGVGVGKTRTARQLARLLQRDKGWRCGLVRRGKEAEAAAVAIESGEPALLIVEDGRHEAVAELLAALARQDHPSRVRALVVVRNGASWRMRMASHTDQAGAELVRVAGQTELTLPSDGPHDHHEQFTLAVSAFAKARRIPEPTDRSDLFSPHASIGAIHAAALLTVLEAEFSSTRLRGRRLPGDSEVYARLLHHEDRSWRLSWTGRGLEPLPDAVYRQIVVVACLLGLGDKGSHEPLSRIPALAGALTERRTHVVEWFEELYPSVDPVFAAVLVTEVLAEDPGLAEAVLMDVPVESVGQVVSVLGCAAQQLPTARPLLQQAIEALPKDRLWVALDLACELGDPLDQDLAGLIQRTRLDLGQLILLDSVLGSKLEAPWCALALLRARLRLPGAARMRVALLTKLVALLREVGEYEEGIRRAREVVRLLRGLVRRGGEELVPDLVRALDSLASLLHDAGHDGKAIGVSGEALKLGRELAQRHVRHQRSLCTLLNNHSAILSTLGKHDRALVVATQAVTVGRSLVTASQPAPDLAHALNTLVNAQVNLNHPGEAIEPARESVDAFRKLAATNMWYLSDLARALSNYGAALRMLTDDEAAGPVLKDAVACWRRVVFSKPHLSHGLVDALINLGSFYQIHGRSMRAVQVWRESLPLAQRLAGINYRYLRQHLIVRCGLGKALSSDGEHGMAVKMLRETVEFAESITEKAYWSMIAKVYDALGAALRAATRPVEALAAMRKGLTWWRKLAKDHPRHRVDLFIALYNIGELLTVGGDDTQAFVSYTEALRHAQRLDSSTSCACHRLRVGDTVARIHDRLRGTRRSAGEALSGLEFTRAG